MDPWDVRIACETLATTNRVVIAGEVRVPRALLKKDKNGTVLKDAAGHPSSTRRSSSRSPARRSATSATSRTASTGRPPRSTCCCTRQSADIAPGRRQRRRPAGRRRCRRPGHHVRLCLPRNAGPHAGADLLQPQDPRAARGRPQGGRRRCRQARPRRQEPGDRPLCRRQAGRSHPDRAVDAASRRELGFDEGPQGRRTLSSARRSATSRSPTTATGTSIRPASS